MTEPSPGGVPGQVLTKTGYNDYETAWQDPTGGGGGGGTPSATVTSETAPGQAAFAGTSLNFSRGDHTHGTPPVPASTPPLNPTAVKTGAYTAAAGELVRCDTTTAAFAITLPSSPADGTAVGVSAEVAPSPVTVVCGGSDTFATGNATTRTLYTAQILVAVYDTGTTKWVLEIEPAPALAPGNYTLLNVATPGQVKIDLSPEVGATDILLAQSGTKITAVDYCQFFALPACTYDNGASGVGAKLTASANGAYTGCDGVTAAAGDFVLIGGQASTFQNGIYTLTAVGDASNPWVFTRDLNFDANTDWNYTVAVYIAFGNMHGGKTVRVKAPPSGFTIGTHGIVVQSGVSLGDANFGGLRNRKTVTEDFTTFNTTPIAAPASPGTHVAGVEGVLLGSGTGAQATQVDTTGSGEVVNGCVGLETGTTATGYATWNMHNAAPLAFDVFNRWEFYIKVKITTVSDATNTFNVKFGFMDTLDGAPANGVYFEARQGSANWLAVCRAASVETAQDSGIVVNTAFRTFNVIAPANNQIRFYSAGVQTNSIVNNVPTAPCYPCFTIVKSAGTVSRVIRVDMCGIDVPSGSNMFAP